MKTFQRMVGNWKEYIRNSELEKLRDVRRLGVRTEMTGVDESPSDKPKYRPFMVHLYYSVVTNKKAQLSLTNPRDACEKFARFT